LFSLSFSLFSLLSFFLSLSLAQRAGLGDYLLHRFDGTPPNPTHPCAWLPHSDAASVQLLFVNFIIIMVFKTEEDRNVRRGAANKW